MFSGELLSKTPIALTSATFDERVPYLQWFVAVLNHQFQLPSLPLTRESLIFNGVLLSETPVSIPALKLGAADKNAATASSFEKAGFLTSVEMVEKLVKV